MDKGAGGITDYTDPAYVALAKMSEKQLRDRVISEMKLEQETGGGREDDLAERVLTRLGYGADYKDKPLVNEIEKIVLEERRRQYQTLAQGVEFTPMLSLRDRVISAMKHEREAPPGRDYNLAKGVIHRLGQSPDKDTPLVNQIKELVGREMQREYQELAQQVQVRPFDTFKDEGLDSQDL